VVGGDWGTAPPSGEKSGSGEITLTVAANPAKDHRPTSRSQCL